MYSVRFTTKKHGTSNVYVLIYILSITAYLVLQYGSNYLTIFCASALMHLLIESGLALSGLRKGDVYAFNIKLSTPVTVLLKSLVEGPAFCVPAYFVADQVVQGNITTAVVASLVVVGLASWYLGWADKSSISKLKPHEQKLVSRRAMTKPKAVMMLALINTGCLSAMFLLPTEVRLHGFIYLIAYAVLVMFFYLINYNLNVRIIETYNPEKKTFEKPGPLFQAAGLIYDSGYEMALLVSPAYWLTFYLGFFTP